LAAACEKISRPGQKIALPGFLFSRHGHLLTAACEKISRPGQKIALPGFLLSLLGHLLTAAREKIAEACELCGALSPFTIYAGVDDLRGRRWIRPSIHIENSVSL